MCVSCCVEGWGLHCAWGGSLNSGLVWVTAVFSRVTSASVSVSLRFSFFFLGGGGEAVPPPGGPRGGTGKGEKSKTPEEKRQRVGIANSRSRSRGLRGVQRGSQLLFGRRRLRAAWWQLAGLNGPRLCASPFQISDFAPFYQFYGIHCGAT
jgi:hypothetical protein